jgi:metal-responsive CopG/Arc/MetJ family transcriptional regulator
MKDAQITLRIPKELARVLSRKAKARGVPKSQLVREAVQKYVAEPEQESDEAFWARARPFIGSVHGDHEAMMADPLARQIYEHNWRE